MFICAGAGKYIACRCSKGLDTAERNLQHITILCKTDRPVLHAQDDMNKVCLMSLYLSDTKSFRPF